MLLILFMYFIFALTFIIGKLSVTHIDPILLIALRMLIAGAILTCYNYFKNSYFKKLAQPSLKMILNLSIFHITIPYCLEFIAFKYSTASKIALIFNLTPLITGLIEHFWYKKYLNRNQFLAIGLALIGTNLVIGETAFSLNSFSCNIADLLVLVSVTSAAAAWLYIAKLLKSGYDIITLNSSSMLVGGLISLVLALIFKSSFNLNYYSWYFIFSLLILGNLIAYNLYGYLLKMHQASLLSLYGALCPIIVALLEWLLFNQKPTYNFLIATLVIAFAIKIFLSSKQSELKNEF